MVNYDPTFKLSGALTSIHIFQNLFRSTGGMFFANVKPALYNYGGNGERMKRAHNAETLLREKASRYDECVVLRGVWRSFSTLI